MSKIIVESLSTLSESGVLKLTDGTTLDLSNTDQWFTLPVESDYLGITNPDRGSLRWNRSQSELEFFDGSTWKKIKTLKPHQQIVQGGLYCHLDATVPESVGQGYGGPTVEIYDDEVIAPGSPRWFDLSGNNQNMILFGGAYFKSDSTCAGYFTFDGVDDYADNEGDITVSGGTRGQFLIDCDYMTMGAWFRSSDQTDIRNIIDINTAGNGGGYSLSFRTGANGNVSTTWRDDSWSSGNYPFFTDTSTNVRDGNWHYLVTVYDSYGVRLYVDGVIKNSTNRSSKLTEVSGQYLRLMGLGNHQNPTVYRTLGDLSAVHIYKRPLSGEEVWQNYLVGYSNYYTTNPIPAPVTNNLVMHYDFSKKDIFAETTSSTPTSYKDTDNLKFVWEDYGSNQANYRVTGPDSISIYVSAGSNWVGGFYGTIPSTGTYTVTFDYASDQSSGTSWAVDNDGVANNAFNSSTDPYLFAYPEWRTFTKTAVISTTGGSKFFIRRQSGGMLHIRNFRIYKSNSYAYVKDLSGNNNWGTITSDLTTPSIERPGFIDTEGGGMVFNRERSHRIKASPNGDSYDWGSNAWTYSVWMRVDQQGDISPVDLTSTTSTHWSFTSVCWTNNTFYIYWRRPSDNTSYSFAAATPASYGGAPIPKDTIFNLTVAYNGSGTSSNSNLAVFRDGIELGWSGTGSGGVGTQGGVIIGGVSYRYQGKIYDVRLWNRRLSSAEILQHVNNTRSRFLNSSNNKNVRFHKTWPTGN